MFQIFNYNPSPDKFKFTEEKNNYCQIDESCHALSLTELPLPKE